jgi:hypothetical protein
MRSRSSKSTSIGLGLLAVTLLVVACGGSGQVVVREGETAAARFAAALERIAVTLGKPAKDVESGIKLKMPGATIDDLAIQAEKTAEETAALERIALAQAAAEAERAKNLEAIHGATCDLISILETASDATTPEEEQQAFASAIVERMQQQEIDLSTQRATAIWDAVLQQYNNLSQNGTVDPSQIGLDLACL